ncbi:di-heme oxidoredictase family protein [Rhabdaerophilum sp. SD176]|uniref:di-heme oxidoreductase family protein n=1 Tax=Rhabdaerophilum sp. SD176 TaxID=2983548 RepID=UPI0024DFC42B|nr:di-heme oxidoredictase family protein [Rhabdaerophilum sp. SD176]
MSGLRTLLVALVALTFEVWALAAQRPKEATAVAVLEPGEEQPGGEATSRAAAINADAFSHPSGNMGFARELDFKVGNGLFRKLWVSAPASTKASDGLGPLYNARACQSCHLKDGRGHPPASDRPEDRSASLLLRLSIPPQTAAEVDDLAAGRRLTIPEPVYGHQLQEFSVQGHPAEGRLVVRYVEVELPLRGGEVVRLRKPAYSIVDPGYGPLHAEAMVSPRIAPPMIGLGLLEAIPEADILALADLEDRDGDGISGRPNLVPSPDSSRPVLGRFGWKAGQPTVLQQSAEAFTMDIGIGTPLTPHPAGDCTDRQQVCLRAPHGVAPGRAGEEISRAMLEAVALYSRNLAVPPRREPNRPEHLRGKRLFSEIGCAACHKPQFRTGEDSPDPHLRGQVIWPYSDMLLHDMGEGLADGRPEGQANGREWRTAPLWGIGLTPIVNGHSFLLHDGRARNATEAILWHGGEAEAARERFRDLNAEDRTDLLAFLNSL